MNMIMNLYSLDSWVKSELEKYPFPCEPLRLPSENLEWSDKCLPPRALPLPTYCVTLNSSYDDNKVSKFWTFAYE